MIHWSTLWTIDNLAVNSAKQFPNWDVDEFDASQGPKFNCGFDWKELAIRVDHQTNNNDEFGLRATWEEDFQLLEVQFEIAEK